MASELGAKSAEHLLLTCLSKMAPELEAENLEHVHLTSLAAPEEILSNKCRESFKSYIKIIIY